MKIALYDDNPIIIEGLSSFFSKKEGVKVVGTASRKSEVMALLASQDIDILVSDVMTDEELGLELFEEIQAMNIETKVIVYLARGMAAKEIAVLTQNSVNTINNQKNHLLAKFECMNTTELVAKLIQMGYIKL
jgi:DNA-binding NarL/FixJ family response regulator